jgi:hypothetical protein
LVNFHHCLYEFRESAAFIAFTDWDELMVVPQKSPQPPIGALFRALAGQHPDAGAFYYQRVAGRMADLGADC